MSSISNTFGIGDKKDPDISLEMLDYKYIDECNNVKTLEKILKTLRSGRDGYFPHLVKHCEEKVAKLNPKSRYLRTEKKILKSRDLPNDEADKLTNGMDEWIDDMKNNETTTTSNGVTEKELPPIRTNANAVQNKDAASEKKPIKSQRIKGSDFKSWDKYDADEECKKIDDPEYVSTKKKKVTLSHTVDSSKMSENDKQVKAGQEKDKGNEAFTAGDYEEALAYYSRSISLHRNAASINNRALTFLRMEKWKDAEKDCDEVLKLEKDNVKAKLRRATALKELDRFEEAKLDLEFVLRKEPNNARALKILKEVEPKIVKKGRKMKILEVEDEEDETLFNGTSFPESKKNQYSNKLTDDGANHSQIDPEGKIVSPESVNNETANYSNASKATENLISDSGGETVVTESTAVKLEPEATNEVVQTPLPAELGKVKAEAGDLFRAGQYGASSEKYTKAIDWLLRKAEDNPDANYSHALATLYNNRAMCSLKSGNDKDCIANCSQVLELKPLDVKALIRRATAYEHMEKYKLAYEDFRAAQTADWSAVQAQTGANRVAKHLRDVHGPNWRDLMNEKTSEDNTKMSKSTPVPSKPKSSALTEGKKPKSIASSKENSTGSVKTSLKKVETASASKTLKNANSTSTTETSTANTSNKNKEFTNDEKRAKLSQKLFAELKEKGNNLVRKGNYAKAIENYTQCIKICPEEVASYTNRALCYLKLGKHAEAQWDCTKALELDPKNVKAFYRRAQANKNLELYLAAEHNLKKVLEIEPSNKSAISELEQVRKLLQTTPRHKLPILEVSEDEDSEEEEDEDEPTESLPHVSKATARHDEIQQAEGESGENKSGTNEAETKGEVSVSDVKSSLSAGEKSPRLVGAMNDQNAKTTDTAETLTAEQKESEEKSKQSKPLASTASTSDTRPVTNVSDFRSQVPKNLTPYEFGNLWNSVQPKTNIEAYKCILDNIASRNIPAIVSNKTNDHLIVTFAQIAHMHVSAGTGSECDRAYNILFELTKADRFEMAAMFLSKADKSVVENAFAQLESLANSLPVTYTGSDVTSLKKLYKF